MRVQYSEAWGGWQAQEMVNGELRTVINRLSRERAINRMIEIIHIGHEIKNIQPIKS